LKVVIIGYRRRKKVDNTAAIISIQTEELTKTKVLNASQTYKEKRQVFR
jgi:hypothetical protein